MTTSVGIRILPAYCKGCELASNCRDVTLYPSGNGCALWHCCFTCPYPSCQVDYKNKANKADGYHRMSGRYNEMRAELASGKSTTEVAEMFNVTHRTVYRAKMAVKQ